MTLLAVLLFASLSQAECSLSLSHNLSADGTAIQQEVKKSLGAKRYKVSEEAPFSKSKETLLITVSAPSASERGSVTTELVSLESGFPTTKWLDKTEIKSLGECANAIRKSIRNVPGCGKRVDQPMLSQL
jgi:hypothetical protein